MGIEAYIETVNGAADLGPGFRTIRMIHFNNVSTEGSEHVGIDATTTVILHMYKVF